jgi:hypothetical protein
MHDEIRVNAVLDRHWSARSTGWTSAAMSTARPPIAGPGVDQASLHGLLARFAT